MRYSDIVASCGNIISNALSISVFYTSQKIKKQKDVGALNPYIFIVMTFNCLSWLIYSSVFHDVNVFISSFLGFIAGVQVCINLYRYLEEDKLRVFELVLLVFTTFYLVLGLILSFLPVDDKVVIGTVSVVTQVLFFFSPLTTIYQVIRTRSVKTLYLPVTLASCAGSILWFAYAVMIRDIYQMICNTFGLATSSVQVLLYLIYGVYKKVEEPLNDLHL